MPDEPKPFKLADDPDFQKMMRMLQGTVVLVQQQGAALRTLSDNSASKSKGKEDDDLDDDDDDDEADPDKMSNKEFAQFLMKQVGTVIDKKIEGVTSRLDETSTTLRTRDLQAEYTGLKEKYKDVDEWGDEMKTLAKQHPTLGLTALYKLAREESPDKVKELDEKYAEKKVDDKGAESLKLFGGMRPSSKTQGEDGKDEKTPVTIESAFEKSWEEAVEALPALGRMGDVLD